jgi:DNA-binding response OmpR family regulator
MLGENPDPMSTAWNIVLVDDDEDFCEMLKAQIELDGEFEVAVAPNAVRGIQLAKVEHVDLLIFDVGLPDLDGREAVRVLRKSGVKIPIIMLSGRDSDADQILGLDAGADDYITKPFEFSVLLARIRVQLRQRERSEDAVFSIGSYTFVPAFKILIKDSGSKLQLTQKETSILKFLCRAGKKVVPRDVLFH